MGGNADKSGSVDLATIEGAIGCFYLDVDVNGVCLDTPYPPLPRRMIGGWPGEGEWEIDVRGCTQDGRGRTQDGRGCTQDGRGSAQDGRGCT